ncbi:hypothetical protein RRG08_004646 [Elysia crispata]|nr:hypothetical protein RRG08_004646 [Elysia crispata]
MDADITPQRCKRNQQNITLNPTKPKFNPTPASVIQHADRTSLCQETVAFNRPVQVISQSVNINNFTRSTGSSRYRCNDEV